MEFTTKQLTQETERLYAALKKVDWSYDDCALYAPMTLEINTLKKEQNAIILAHSYQTPDIMYGVADFIGDSYGLSVIAKDHPAEKIIFCSVHFMGETAKILSPEKEVLVPAVAGCSLADSITAEDVRQLKAKHPGAGVVCYVNTSAEVKAESDCCCTSSNALKIINNMPQDKIIFIPDEFMGKNLQKKTDKKLILWNGRCIVHEEFTPEAVSEIRKNYPGVKILAHLECSPQVTMQADMTGSTNEIMKFIADTNAESYMIVTECGITDRVKSEHPEKTIVGTCSLCPYMKKIQLKDVLACLKNPTEDQTVTLDSEISQKAQHCLNEMLRIAQL